MEIVNKLKDMSPPDTVSLDDLLHGGRTAAGSVLLVRALASDFGVRDEACIIQACDDATLTGSADEAICSYIANIHGPSDEDFADAVLIMLNRILSRCKGLYFDHSYYEKELEGALSYRLKMYGLKVTFSGGKWKDPFVISLQDLNSGAILETEDFEYSDYERRRDAHEIIDVINNMIAGRGLVFFKAEDGSDSYNFILFRKPELERLNKKYGDVRKLIDWDYRVDNFRNLPKRPPAPDPTEDPEFKEIVAELDRLAGQSMPNLTSDPEVKEIGERLRRLVDRLDRD